MLELRKPKDAEEEVFQQVIKDAYKNLSYKHDCSKRTHVVCTKCWRCEVSTTGFLTYFHDFIEKECECRECYDLEFKHELFRAMMSNE